MDAFYGNVRERIFTPDAESGEHDDTQYVEPTGEPTNTEQELGRFQKPQNGSGQS